MAAQGRIVAFGIKPDHAATSYGYIRPGAKLDGVPEHEIDAFVEKPDAITAANYVAQHYLWNSGKFLLHGKTMLAEIEAFEPTIAQAAKNSIATLTRGPRFFSPGACAVCECAGIN